MGALLALSDADLATPCLGVAGVVGAEWVGVSDWRWRRFVLETGAMTTVAGEAPETAQPLSCFAFA